jgi:selenocysteine lyase/cysteine desulfurase
VAARILELKRHLVGQLEPLGFRIHGVSEGPAASGITTFHHESRSATELFKKLEAAHVISSLRHDREGRDYIRVSPHYYNTEEEIDRVVEVLRGAL